MSLQNYGPLNVEFVSCLLSDTHNLEKESTFLEILWTPDIQSVPLATKPDISFIILPLMRILQRNLKRTYLIA